MIVHDDRTPDQATWSLIVGTDSFLSGWGKATGGSSYAAWACPPGTEDQVYRWVSRRGDMRRVRWAAPDYRPSPRHCKHLHIYVVDSEHRALQGD